MNDRDTDHPSVLFEARRFRVETATRKKPDGSVHVREVIRHAGAVTILPMVDNEHICLIKNFRVAVDETLIELPAGTLESGETPLTTASRELTEETGYSAKSVRRLNTFYLSPGILDEQMHLFLATELTAGPAAREPNEEIENFVVSWKDAIELVMNGSIRDAKTIVGLLYYARHIGR